MKYVEVPVESLVPGQRFTEVGISAAGLADDRWWYLLDWVDPTTNTYAFRTVIDALEPGSMRYYPADRVVIEVDDGVLETPNQVRRVDAERVGDLHDVAQRHVPLAALDRPDVRPVQLSDLG